MQIKRSGSRIFGAVLTAAEKKAMNMEIQRQLAEYDRKHVMEIDALILWQLHVQLGFGPTRLRKFYNQFAKELDALVKRYEMEDDDQVWLCTHKLKDLGVDLEQWEKERING